MFIKGEKVVLLKDVIGAKAGAIGTVKRDMESSGIGKLVSGVEVLFEGCICPHIVNCKIIKKQGKE